ncbi:SHOCT domain-containing protein [Nocardioides sp. SR21]|uniref:SHOCT domain-containing protein n=1 Tax=Nocardioides sp. SR21 TaxID=2919501 RepID=UPI001FAA4CEA|nr:SHOCT domain-containing protein [Nocardioides sp. SR21]
MVVLVPRQVRMTGMTGNVPYYGGRFTPAQAYAAAHPAPPPPPPAPEPAPERQQSLSALKYLLADGVITPAEYDELRARLDP